MLLNTCGSLRFYLTPQRSGPPPSFPSLERALLGPIGGRKVVYCLAADLFERRQQGTACVRQLVGDRDGRALIDGARDEPGIRQRAEPITDLGFGTFVLATPPDPDTLTTFIENVAPKVRERVAELRGSSRERPGA